MAFGDEDLAAILGADEAFSVPVVYGAQTTSGVFSETESPSDYGSFVRDPAYATTAGADLVERSTFLVVPTAQCEAGGALVGLAEDDALTVDGRAFRVRGFGPIEDGRMTRIRLAEVP